MACYTEILCPHCKSKEVAKAGFSEQGKQRYRCKNIKCAEHYCHQTCSLQNKGVLHHQNFWGLD